MEEYYYMLDEPQYDYVQRAIKKTGISDLQLHAVWCKAAWDRDDCNIDDVNRICEVYYKRIEELKPTNEEMLALDKFYFNDDDEIATTVYFRHEYDYPLYEDYIAELNGVVDFAGLMTFTIIQPVRHRRSKINK